MPDAPPPPALLEPHVVGIHHVALAVPDLDAALELWQGTFGARVLLRDRVEDQGVEAAALAFPRTFGDAPPAGVMPFVTELELVAPLAPDSGVQRFLDRRGAGMHHVAWAVTDVATTLDLLARAGTRLIDAEPRTGLHGTPVAFVHPQSTGGVLVELVEVPAP